MGHTFGLIFIQNLHPMFHIVVTVLTSYGANDCTIQITVSYHTKYKYDWSWWCKVPNQQPGTSQPENSMPPETSIQERLGGKSNP